VNLAKPKDADLSENTSCIIVDDDLENNDTPLIAQLKERIVKSELEVKELLDQLNNENK